MDLVESLQLGPACRKLCHTRFNPPPPNRSNNPRRATRARWPDMQRQSQSRLVSSAADWCSPCSDDEVSQFKISQIHGM
jgi:hypothetical protein